MTLAAIAGALTGNRMVERFHADPRVQATELLLQERVPRHAALIRPRPDEETRVAAPVPPAAVRRFRSPHTAVPARAVPLERQLHRGRHERGRRRELLPRARRHAVAPGRDPRSRAASSSTCATCGAGGSGPRRITRPRATRRTTSSTFTMEKATFQRRDDEIGTQLDVAVSPEDDVEVRRLAVTNHGDRARELEVTSYAEIVLAPNADDLAHPAFGKLFVESEYVAESNALLCRRRPRAPDDAEVFAVHVISQEGRTQGPVEWETDRGALPRPRPRPGGSAGARRAPALRHDRRPARPDREPAAARAPRARAAWCGSSFATGMASSRETALALAQRYHDPSATARTFALAFAHARSRLHHLGISSEEALLFERLASRVLYADASLRPAPEVLARNTLGQEGLWGHGVSGDLPILLVRVVSDDGPRARAPGPAGAGVLAPEGAQRGRGDPERAPGRATSTRCTPSSPPSSTTGPGARGSTGRAARTSCAGTG